MSEAQQHYDNVAELVTKIAELITAIGDLETVMLRVEALLEDIKTNTSTP